MLNVTLRNTYEYAELSKAYRDARKHKRRKATALEFEYRQEQNLRELSRKLTSGQYSMRPAKVFAVDYPKPREVWACDFEDRIVQHAVCNDIMPAIESTFIEHSFSCIKGRGTGAAIHHAERCARRATRGWSKPALALQIDIANFFCSINRKKLYELFVEKIGENSLTANILKKVYSNDPTLTCVYGGVLPLGIVPTRKSLFHTREDTGLAIGWLMSQLGSNVYLDALDKFVKHDLKIKYYARYVDVILIFGHDKEELKSISISIDNWLAGYRCLRLHPEKTHITNVHEGVDFVGAVILPWRTVPRKSTSLRAIDAARRVASPHAATKDIAGLNSYLGLLRSMQSYYLRRTLCNIARKNPLIRCDAAFTKIFTQHS